VDVVVAADDEKINFAEMVELRRGGNSLFKKWIGPAAGKAFGTSQHKPNTPVRNQRGIRVSFITGRIGYQQTRGNQRDAEEGQQNNAPE
jgi:hypothetical protein